MDQIERRHTPIPSTKLINKWSDAAATIGLSCFCVCGKIKQQGELHLFAPRRVVYSDTNICRMLMNTRIFNWFICACRWPPFTVVVLMVVVVTGFTFYIVSFYAAQGLSWHKCEEMGSQDKIMSALCHGMRRPIVAVMSWSTSKANYIELWFPIFCNKKIIIKY